MRWKLLWYGLIAVAAVGSYILNFNWPPSLGGVLKALATAETWWATHAANPLLSAFLFGLASGTMFLPELWRQLRPHIAPIKLRPDVDGPEAFKTLLNRSKRAKELIKKGLLTTPLTYESHLTKAAIIEGRLQKKLEDEIHDLLRLGEITAWGTPDGRRPYEKITPESWSLLEIDFSQIDREGSSALHAIKSGRQTTGTAYGYVWLKFCRTELYREYPLSWWPRRRSNKAKEKPTADVELPTEVVIEPADEISTSVARFIRGREHFTIAEAACLLAEIEIKQDNITGPASGYLHDIKKQILEGKIKAINFDQTAITLARITGNQNTEVIKNSAEISKDQLRKLAKTIPIEIPGIGAR